MFLMLFTQFLQQRLLQFGRLRKIETVLRKDSDYEKRSD